MNELSRTLSRCVAGMLFAASAVAAHAQQAPSPRGEPPAQAQPGGSPTERAEAAFRQVDADGDGKLSAEELNQYPSVASQFGRMDKDKDGFLSIKEFTAGITVNKKD